MPAQPAGYYLQQRTNNGSGIARLTQHLLRFVFGAVVARVKAVGRFNMWNSCGSSPKPAWLQAIPLARQKEDTVKCVLVYALANATGCPFQGSAPRSARIRAVSAEGLGWWVGRHPRGCRNRSAMLKRTGGDDLRPAAATGEGEPIRSGSSAPIRPVTTMGRLVEGCWTTEERR